MMALLQGGAVPASSQDAYASTPTVTFGRKVSISDASEEWKCPERETLAPPEKTQDVPPDYSDVLQRRRLQGTVVLEARVSPEGRVTDVSVAGDPSLLDAAAVDAVRQWRYKPTLLCGKPVPVRLSVSVSFTDELRLEDKRANRSFNVY
jgi:TonB family protein